MRVRLCTLVNGLPSNRWLSLSVVFYWLKQKDIQAKSTLLIGLFIYLTFLPQFVIWHSFQAKGKLKCCSLALSQGFQQSRSEDRRPHHSGLCAARQPDLYCCDGFGPKQADRWPAQEVRATGEGAQPLTQRYKTPLERTVAKLSTAADRTIRKAEQCRDGGIRKWENLPRNLIWKSNE